MSKQLSISAAIAVFAMAAFALLAEPVSQRANEMGAPASANASHFEVSLKGL